MSLHLGLNFHFLTKTLMILPVCMYVYMYGTPSCSSNDTTVCVCLSADLRGKRFAFLLYKYIFIYI